MNSFIKKLTFTGLLLFVTVASAFAGDPNGTWKFKAEAGGRSVESTLTLHWENGRLTGVIDNRAGKVDISEATFLNDQVTFTVVRELGRRMKKRKFTINYSGKLAGDTITGTIQTNGRDKQPVSFPWTAERVK